MRISDWSSDVCSSDLPCSLLTRKAALLRLEQEGDRAVVDQADHHMGTEPAGFHPRRMIFPAACQQPAENPFSLFRRGRGAEPRPHARARVRRQRELADQQKAAPAVGQRAVHAAPVVGADPIPEPAPRPPPPPPATPPPP